VNVSTGSAQRPSSQYCGPGCLAVVILSMMPAPAVVAQGSQPSRLAIDTVIGVDGTANAAGTTGSISADALVSYDFGRGVQFVARPFVQRLSATGEWNAQVWLAAFSIEGGENVAFRVDAGIIPSPVGMANLLLRPHTNPTIALPASLFSALPLVEIGGPRTPLLGAIYPLGVSTTLSALHWDVRASIIDTSPLRPRRVFAREFTNPPRLRNVVVGGGLTPFVGVRVGGSVTRGDWQHEGESAAADQDRPATIATIEADLAYRRSRVQAEWTRDVLSVRTGTVIARGWFVQGLQTLSPRWFVAGRVEAISSPAIVSAPDRDSVVRQRRTLRGLETTVGFRLSTDLTLRTSYRMRRAFGQVEADHIAAASLVWWRRWW